MALLDVWHFGACRQVGRVVTSFLNPRSDCPYCDVTDLADYAWWTHIQNRHPKALNGPDFERVPFEGVPDEAVHNTRSSDDG